MIKLIKVQFAFTMTKKLRIISTVLVLGTGLLLFYLSNIYLPVEELSFNQAVLIESYLYDSLNVIKIIMVLFAGVMVIYTFIINNYDIYIFIRSNRSKTIVSKVVVTCLVVYSLFIYIYLLFIIFMGMLDSELLLRNIFAYFVNLSVFIGYFTLLFIMLTMTYKTIFVVIIPFVGYLVSTLSIDYGVSVQSLSVFSKSINFVFPDLLLVEERMFFVYDIYFVIGLCLVLLIAIYRKYQGQDIIL